MPASVEAENKALIRRFYDELNHGHLDVIDELVASNYIGHMPGLPELHGIVALKTFHKNAITAIPPRSITLEDLVAEADKVVKRYSVYGVHSGEFFGIPPTYKEVNITGFSLLRIDNGKEDC